VAIIREGDTNQVFGILMSGFVEVSIEGRSLCRLGAGEVVGEVAYLHPNNKQRHATVVTLEPTRFLELNAAALALSSDELQERMRNALIARMIDRMRQSNQIAAAHGEPAVEPGTGSLADATRSTPGSGVDLELMPI
jgi:CRP-like cAMP-binding protein